MMSKKRREYLGAKISTGIVAEIDRAEPPAAATPSSMIPRPHDKVNLIVTVGLFERFVERQRSVKIFLVPPSSDDQRRHAGVRYIKVSRARLPICVPRRMLEKRLPRMRFRREFGR